MGLPSLNPSGLKYLSGLHCTEFSQGSNKKNTNGFSTARLSSNGKKFIKGESELCDQSFVIRDFERTWKIDRR